MKRGRPVTHWEEIAGLKRGEVIFPDRASLGVSRPLELADTELVTCDTGGEVRTICGLKHAGQNGFIIFSYNPEETVQRSINLIMEDEQKGVYALFRRMTHQGGLI